MINLTSMMDILTTLLLFLLSSFVAGGEAVVPPPGVTLPSSTATQRPPESVVVAIDGAHVLLGTERVARVDAIAASTESTVPELAARLAEAAAQQDELAQRRGGAAPEVRAATLQGDEQVEYRVLQKVMRTLEAAGFGDIALAVVRRT
jgi:biopolymer transport protein ExbD